MHKKAAPMTEIIILDGKEIDLSNLSDTARNLVASLRFIEVQVHQLESEWAVADTARRAYAAAIKSELIRPQLEVGDA